MTIVYVTMAGRTYSFLMRRSHAFAVYQNALSGTEEVNRLALLRLVDLAGSTTCMSSRTIYFLGFGGLFYKSILVSSCICSA